MTKMTAGSGNRAYPVRSTFFIAAVFLLVLLSAGAVSADPVPRLSEKKFRSELIAMASEYEKEVTREQAERNPYVSQRLIVKSSDRFIDPEDYGAVDAIQNREGTYILQFESAAKARRAEHALQKEGSTEYAEPDLMVFAAEEEEETVSASDASAGSASLSAAEASSVPWNIEQTGLKQYADYIAEKKLGRKIIVAVLDTGISFTHPMIQSRLLTEKAKSFATDHEEDIRDESYYLSPNECEVSTSARQAHGTHVAGIIVQCTPGLDVRLLPVRVLNSDRTGFVSLVNEAIQYAVNTGAEIINLSFAGCSSIKAKSLEEKIQNANNSGATVIVSAGNDGCALSDDVNKQYVIPGYIPECIVVGAVDENKDRASYSNYGETLDVVAPGVSIFSSVFTESGENKEGYMSGTSMAAPHVAAEAAMIRMVYGNYKPSDIETMIKSKAGSSRNNYYGYGPASVHGLLPRHKVTYAPGEHGAFSAVTHTVEYGLATPAAPAAASKDGYEFSGWSPAVRDTVTLDAVYTAQWKIPYAVQKVISEINSLSSVITLQDQTAVETARKDYQSLTAEQKKLVGNYAALAGAQAKIESLLKEQKQAEEEKKKAEEEKKKAEEEKKKSGEEKKEQESSNYAGSDPYANVTYRVPLKKKQKTNALRVLGLADGDGVASWKSSDSRKVTVRGNADGSCRVSAGSRTGNASVTATCRSGRKVVFRIKVQKNKVKTKKIRIPSRTVKMSPGEKLLLCPELYPVTSTDKLKYTSGNRKTVTVSGSGVLKAVKKGTAVVTVKSGSRKIKVKVIVS